MQKLGLVLHARRAHLMQQTGNPEPPRGRIHSGGSAGGSGRSHAVGHNGTLTPTLLPDRSRLASRSAPAASESQSNTTWSAGVEGRCPVQPDISHHPPPPISPAMFDPFSSGGMCPADAYTVCHQHQHRPQRVCFHK